MRVLIVAPHFAPSNTADSHRVRLLLPFVEEFGWKAEVLAIRPEDVAAPVDEWLLSGIPESVVVHRLKALGLEWRRIPGLGTLDYRSLPVLKRAGDKLLSERRFDLVFFSTTVFGVHSLGVRWKKKFGVPFAMDFQDHWTTDFYKKNRIRPPGGWLKYTVSAALSKRQQRLVLSHCDGIVAVTHAFRRSLVAEHSRVERIPFLELPFPASRSDRERIRHQPVQQNYFQKNDGRVHWLYVGVCGPLMHKAVSALLTAVAQQVKKQPELADKLRLHFIGTSYAPAGQGIPSVMPLAESLGIAPLVHEITDRIPYSQTLQCLEDADALIVPGTDDPDYTASKIYSYLLTSKPLLAVFRRESSVCDLLKKVGGANYVEMAQGQDIQDLANRVQSLLLGEPPYIARRELNEEAFQAYCDRASARKLTDLFRDVVRDQ